MDITRVKKIEKSTNHMPSDNLLDGKDNKLKGLLPSKHDFMDKASKSRITSTTRASVQTNPTTKAPTTKAPTTKTISKVKSPIRPRTKGIRNLAKKRVSRSYNEVERTVTKQAKTQK